jgi:hypothetical protein
MSNADFKNERLEAFIVASGEVPKEVGEAFVRMATVVDQEMIPLCERQLGHGHLALTLLLTVIGASVRSWEPEPRKQLMLSFAEALGIKLAEAPRRIGSQRTRRPGRGYRSN